MNWLLVSAALYLAIGSGYMWTYAHYRGSMYAIGIIWLWPITLLYAVGRALGNWARVQS